MREPIVFWVRTDYRVYTFTFGLISNSSVISVLRCSDGEFSDKLSLYDSSSRSSELETQSDH